MRRLSVLVLLLAATWGLTVAKAGAYTVLPLDTTGVHVVEVDGLEPSGVVVGNAEFTESSKKCFAPFEWHAGVFQRLADTFCGTEAESGLDAIGVDAAGEIVAERPEKQFSLLWATPTTPPTTLPDEPLTVPECGPPGAIETTAGISGSGDITGYWIQVTSECRETASGAFLLKHGAANAEPAADDLGAAECTGFKEAFSRGLAINDSDELVVASTCVNGSQTFCYRWAAGVASPLPPGACDLPGQLPPRPASTAINDSGVVLSRTLSELGTASVAEYVTREGNAIALPPLEGDNEAVALGLDDNGDVVGDSWVKGEEADATLWPARTPPATGPPPAPVDLNSLISPGAGVTLHNAFRVASDGYIIARGAVKETGAIAYFLLKPAEGLSVAAGAQVDEPESGTVPQTFTISLGEAKAEPVSVEYETVDGTAKTAAHEYAATHGSVVFAPGQTTKEITVEVENGSGIADAPTLGYEVRLKNAKGAAVETGSATGVIVVPEVTGKLTNTSGEAQPGVEMSLTGIAGSGQSVTREVLTDGGGRYQLFADPGTYTVSTPSPEGPDEPAYEPVECPATSEPEQCSGIALTPGASIALDFKLLDYIVNNSGDGDDSPQAEKLGLCDTSPDASAQTCTLRAALEVAAKRTRAPTIGFDIPGSGTPVIDVEAKETEAAPYELDTNANIDGTTQPGGVVDLRQGGAGELGGVGLVIAGSHLSVRGLNIAGFAFALQVGEFPVIPGGRAVVPRADQVVPVMTGTGATPLYTPVTGVTIQDMKLSIGPNLVRFDEDQGPVTVKRELDGALLLLDAQAVQIGGPGPQQSDSIYGPVFGFGATGLEFERDAGEFSVDLSDGGDNTIGSSAQGRGNTIGSVNLSDESDDVIQGNHIVAGVQVEGGDHDTIGGPTTTPGSAPGNVIEDIGENGQAGVGLSRSDRDVLQGNRVSDPRGGIRLTRSERVTIGGAGAGNMLTGPHRADVPGVEFAEGSDQNVLEGNLIEGYSPGVVVDRADRATNDPVGDTVRNDTIGSIAPGIELGPSFQYNTLASLVEQVGPNHLQPYPVVVSATEDGGSTRVHLRLDAPAGSYQVELYSQPGCELDGMSPGGAEHSLGVRTVKVGHIETEVAISVASAKGAVTATATSSDGSTSELGPCLTLGERPPSLAQHGVTLLRTSVAVTTTATGTAATRATARSHRIASPPVADLQPYCPPISSSYCAGTLVLREASHRVIARLAFKVAPASIGTVAFRLTAPLARALRRSGTLRLSMRIAAHDGARHPHHKTTAAMLTLRASP